MKNNLKSKKISLCGVFAAICLVLMMFGSILPFSSYLAPALSGITLIPIAYEFNKRTAFLLFFSIALLSVFLVADKEMAFLFLAFLGWYPIFKISFDKIKNKILRIIAKFTVFNISIVLMYYFIIFLFPIDAVVASFENLQYIFIVVLIVLANVTFVIYDIALARFTFLYNNFWRKILFR